MRREPTSFASPSDRNRRKWHDIVSSFMAGDLDKLRTIQRTGARGRIFAMLIRWCFDELAIGYESEPVFPHVRPAEWYTTFATQHELKLATHDYYNPDFLLADGIWAEVTLSENTAFKKLFRYAHQAPRLLVVWLDRYQRQVISPKRCGILPLIAVLVQSGERNVVVGTIAGVISPDGRLDTPETDFANRLLRTRKGITSRFQSRAV